MPGRSTSSLLAKSISARSECAFGSTDHDSRATLPLKGIERITPRFEGGELLLFEESFRRIRIVSPQRHADDFFSRGNVRRARAFGLCAQTLRDQPPGEFIDLRIRIDSRRGQEFFELPEAVR